MDTLSIVIIVISVVLAVVFKWVLFAKIRRWMDTDLIRQLSQGETEMEQELTRYYQELRAKGTKRKDIHERLQQLADRNEPKA